jgi:lysozyme family protein
MKENLGRCLDILFGEEGGFTKDPRDRGNWTGGKVGSGKLLGTKYGIAANTFPHLDIPNLTKAQAEKIYREQYWNAINGDTLASGVDLAAFDAAVNSGAGRSKRWLMQSLGGDAVDTVEKMTDKRRSFLRGLDSWRTYGKGWSNRVNRIETTGKIWAMQEQGLTDVQIAAELKKDGLTFDPKAKLHTAVATAAPAEEPADDPVLPSDDVEGA